MAIGNSRSISREVRMLALILLVFAFVLFTVAAFRTSARFDLIAAGLACWVASQLVGAVVK